MRKSMLRTLAIISLLLLGGSAGVRAQDDVVLKAMRDEMARTMKQLQLENLQKPYFVAYEVRDLDTASVAATLGALTSSEKNHSRWLSVQVRVGDYNLDNTNFVSMSGFAGAGVMRGFGNMAQLPLGDDYKEIRRQIWLATDAAYKKAVQDLARKRAALENKTRSDEVPDFVKEPVVSNFEKPSTTGFDTKRAEALVERLSAVFKSSPEIVRSSAAIVEVNEYARYLNSEGTEFTRGTPYVGLTVAARTQAADGLPVSDAVTAHTRTLEGISDDLVEAGIRGMCARLLELRSAPLVTRYNGPVLFEGQASAEIFAQAFVPKLVASRRPIADNPAFEMVFARAQSPFQERIGARVLPDWATLTDDATVASYQGQPLLGAYTVDDEGVRAGKTSLIENGILKSLLVSRDPVRGLTHSTGNVRGFGITPSNLILTARDGLDDKALKAKLLSLVQQRGAPFGIIVRRLHDPFAEDPQEAMGAVMSTFMPGMGGSGPVQTATLAYEVFPDGREQLIRNAQLEGLNQASFKDLVAASANARVYNKVFLDPASMITRMFSGGGIPDVGNLPLVSLVVPDLIFDEVSVNPPSGTTPKPPLSAPPAGK